MKRLVSGNPQSPVTAVTETWNDLGETSFVTKVRKPVIRLPLSRVARGGSGKGKPRLASLLGSPVAAYYRPPVPATGPRLLLVHFLYYKASASEAKSSFGGDFLGSHKIVQHFSEFLNQRSGNCVKWSLSPGCQVLCRRESLQPIHSKHQNLPSVFAGNYLNFCHNHLEDKSSACRISRWEESPHPPPKIRIFRLCLAILILPAAAGPFALPDLFF